MPEQVRLDFVASTADMLKGLSGVQRQLQEMITASVKAGTTHQKAFTTATTTVSKLAAAQSKLVTAQLQALGVTQKTTSALRDNSVAVNKTKDSYNSLERQIGFTIRQMVGVYAVVNTVKKAFSEGFNFNKFIEGAQATFSTMLKSGTAAKELLTDLYNFAVKSPLRFTDTVAASKQLMAYGFAAKEVVKTMELLGTVGTAVGVSLGDMAYVYGTLRSQGRAYTRDLMQFAMRGIPIYEELSKVMGISVKDVQKLTAEGQVGFREVEKAFINMTTGAGRFAGFLSDYMETVAGKMNMLADIAQKAAGVLAEGVFDVWRNSIDGFTAALMNPKVLENLRELGTSLGSMVGFVAGLSVELLQNLPLIIDITSAFIKLKLALWGLQVFTKLRTWIADMPYLLAALSIKADAAAASINTMVASKTILSISDMTVGFRMLASGLKAVAVAAGNAALAFLFSPAGIVLGISTVVGGLAALAYRLGQLKDLKNIIAIGDAGTGIAPENIQKITREYERLLSAKFGMSQQDAWQAMLAPAQYILDVKKKEAEVDRVMAIINDQMNQKRMEAVREIAAANKISNDQAINLLETHKKITSKLAEQLRMYENMYRARENASDVGVSSPADRRLRKTREFAALTGLEEPLVYGTYDMRGDSARDAAGAYMGQQGGAARAYIAQLESAREVAMAQFRYIRGIAMPADKVADQMKDTIASVIKTLEDMYLSKEWGEGWTFAADPDVQWLQWYMTDLQKKIDTEFSGKNAPVVDIQFSTPEWDKWFAIDLDAAAFTKLTQFWEAYKADTEKLRQGELSSIRHDTQEQYQLYIKYQKDIENATGKTAAFETELASELAKLEKEKSGTTNVELVARYQQAINELTASGASQRERITTDEFIALRALQAKYIADSLAMDAKRVAELTKLTFSLPEWDSWATVEEDAAAFTKLTDEYTAYAAAASDATKVVERLSDAEKARLDVRGVNTFERLSVQGIDFDTQEQYQQYIQYLGDIRAVDLELAQWKVNLAEQVAKAQKDIAKADVSERSALNVQLRDFRRQAEDELSVISKNASYRRTAIEEQYIKRAIEIHKNGMAEIADEIKNMVMPDWDKWFAIDVDASAFSKLTDFWAGYEKTVEWAVQGTNKLTQEQYQLYIQYHKDMEDADSRLSSWQIANAEEVARQKKVIAELTGKTDAASVARKIELEEKLVAYLVLSGNRELEIEKWLIDAKKAIQLKAMEDSLEADRISLKEQLDQRVKYMKEGNQELWAQQAAELIDKKGFGNIAKGVGMEAIAGTEVGKMMAGGDPLTMAMMAFAKFAMSIENVNKILNPFATIFEAMRPVVEALLNDALQPLVNILELVGSVAAQIVAPFIGIAQVVTSFAYGLLTTAIPIIPIISAIGGAFEWFHSNVIVPVGNKIIDVFNGVITVLNELPFVNIQLLKHIALIGKAAEVMKKSLEDKAKLVGNTLTWLSDKMKSEMESQRNSWQELWEVGAISTTKFMEEMAKVDEYEKFFQDELLKLNLDQLNTLEGMAETLVALRDAEKLLKEGTDVDLSKIPGVSGGRTTTVKGVIVVPPAPVPVPPAPVPVPPAPVPAGWAGGTFVGGKLYTRYPRGYASGTINVPQDMVANIHAGEGVIPSTFMAAVRRGDISIAGPSGGRQRGENGVYVTVNVEGSVRADKDLAKVIAKEIYTQNKRGTGV